MSCFFFFFQAEDGIRVRDVTGVQTCALPIYRGGAGEPRRLREEVAVPDRGPHGRGDREAEQEAGRDGPLDRGTARPDHRWTWPVRGDGRDRSRAFPRRAAAADLRPEVRDA